MIVSTLFPVVVSTRTFGYTTIAAGFVDETSARAAPTHSNIPPEHLRREDRARWVLRAIDVGQLGREVAAHRRAGREALFELVEDKELYRCAGRDLVFEILATRDEGKLGGHRAVRISVVRDG